MADPDELGDTDGHYSEIQDSGVSSLTGFLFGNIDEKGELEGDFLDEVNIKKTKQNHRLKICIHNCSRIFENKSSMNILCIFLIATVFHCRNPHFNNSSLVFVILV